MKRAVYSLLIFSGALISGLEAFEAPEAPPIEFYQELWAEGKSPFDRKVLPDKPVTQEQVEYVIQSTWKVGEVRFLSVKNKLNQETALLATDPDQPGVTGKLVAFEGGYDPSEIKADIEINGRKLAIKFDQQAISGPTIAQQAAKAVPQQNPNRRVILPGSKSSNSKQPVVRRTQSRGIVLPGR
ncbi:MAG: hypothetical protein AAFY98_03100 [Verrucomicrobiota bacterium]